MARTALSPGDRPRELALTPDGSTLAAANSGSDSVGFFDTGTLTSQGRANVGSGPGAIVMDPTGRRVFVFNTLSASISVVDIASRAIVATLATDAAAAGAVQRPRRQAVHPQRALAYSTVCSTRSS